MRQQASIAAMATLLAVGAAAGCASTERRPSAASQVPEPPERTAPAVGMDAAAGAKTALRAAEQDADRILRGGAVGASMGAAAGAYMDEQQERLARIPGTRVDRIDHDTLVVRFESETLFASGSATLGT